MTFNLDSSSAGPYVVEDRAQGPTLVVTSRWSAAAEAALEDPAVDGLELNYARGYAGEDLSFLSDDLGIRRLQVLDRTLTDLTGVAEMRSLVELRVDSAPGTRLDVSGLASLRLLAADWEQVEGLDGPEQLHELVIAGYDAEDLTPLSDVRGLRVLELLGRPKVRSLAGVEQQRDLTSLKVANARQLDDFEPLGALDGLRQILFESVPGFDRLDRVRSHPHLRDLGFSDCGSIASLKPLQGLDELEYIGASGSTRVEDGDLSPLLQLPNLRHLEMQNRRTYDPAVKDVQRALEARA